MTNFPFDNSIPAANNNPSDDQPDMLVNNQSAAAIWTEDHFGFNVANGGLHQQVRTLNRLTIPTVATGQIGLYSKARPGGSALFFTSDAIGKEYQITRSFTSVATNALFGTSTNNYNGAGLEFSGGWTFLPGGIIYNYGIINYGPSCLPPAVIIVPYAAAYTTTTFNIQLSLICKVGGTSASETISVIAGSDTSTNFQINGNSVPTTSYTGIYWSSMGI